MKLLAMVLPVLFGIATEAGQTPYETVFPPTAVAIDNEALASLTTAQPVAKCQAPITTVSLSGGAMPGGVVLAAKIAFAVGPSFSVAEDSVVSWLDAIDGELTVGRGATSTAWKVRQFNFLNQAARANWNRTTKQLSVLLPVVLTREGHPDTHTFLVAMGTVEGQRIVWKRLLFTLTDMVARAFPGSPPIEQVLELWVTAPTPAPKP